MSDLTKLLTQLKDLQKSQERIVIAIEGPAGAGKTTLARKLAAELSSFIFQMDDFFLPISLRTPKRLEEIGGNIHYERFLEEVLQPLKQNKPFTYQIFNCQTQNYEQRFFDNQTNIIIIEGVYSYHQLFQHFYDYLIYCNITEELQLNRLKQRSTPEIYANFLNRWLPLERKYFLTNMPMEYADFLIEATNKT